MNNLGNLLTTVSGRAVSREDLFTNVYTEVRKVNNCLSGYESIRYKDTEGAVLMTW